MILLDLEDKGKYKGKGFEYGFLKEENIIANPVCIKYETNIIQATEEQKAKYEKEKSALFQNLAKKDPDTIPRALHLLTGGFKKPYLKDYEYYISRNKRFGLDNVVTYKDSEIKNCTVIDFPIRALEMNDYIKRTETNKVTFICSDLNVDKVYNDNFKDWIGRLKDFYAKTSL